MMMIEEEAELPLTSKPNYYPKEKVLLVGTKKEKSEFLQKICGEIKLTDVRSVLSVDEIPTNETFDIVYFELTIGEFENLVKRSATGRQHPIYLFGLREFDVRTIVRAIRLGAFDCITEQDSVAEILEIFKKARENLEMNRLHKTVERERFDKLQAELDWNSFRKDLIRRDMRNKDSHLISNIRTSLSQGSGFGALLSVVSLIRKKAKHQGSHYEVPTALIEMLTANTESASKIIEVFNEMDYLIHNTQTKENFAVSQIHGLFTEEIVKLNDLAASKSLTIKICEDKYANVRDKIGINEKSFRMAIGELLMNAVKFSELKKVIYILFTLHKDRLLISILNSPKSEEGIRLGIPKEESEFVFQPFARLTKLVHEDIPSLDYGLGLPLVEKIVANHEGRVTAFNVMSFLNEEENLMVLLEIDLPIRDIGQ